jgi:hypothetical protein
MMPCSLISGYHSEEHATSNFTGAEIGEEACIIKVGYKEDAQSDLWMGERRT